jgi:Family of unknown function (DUF6308)
VREMSSIASLRSCALLHLSSYTAPGGVSGFAAYDVQGDPVRLYSVDCLAPRFLGVDTVGSAIVAMQHAGTPEAALWAAMREVVADPRCAAADFVADGLQDQALCKVADTIRLSRHTAGIKAVTVSKILHRKLPKLVPIIGRHVYRFHTGMQLPPAPYGESVARFWAALHQDLRANLAWLDPLAGGFVTPDGRPLSVLRAAEIVVWHHAISGCRGSGIR